MTTLEIAVSFDVAGSLAGIGSIIAAIAAVKAARASKQAGQQAATAATQLTTTNGGSTFRDSQNRQEAALEAIQDGVRSLGHQVGEIRADMGRLDDRLTREVQDLRGRITG